MADGNALTRLRYRYLSGRLVGEVLSKSWIDSAIPVAALVVTIAVMTFLIPGLFNTAYLADIARQLAEQFGTVIVYITANPAQIGNPAPTALGVVQKPFSQHVILAAVELAISGKAREASGQAGEAPPELSLYIQARG